MLATFIECHIVWTRFVIPTKFVVGYGMDYNDVTNHEFALEANSLL